MMPTPVLYTGSNARPLFTDPPADTRSPSLDLLFVTDRASAQQADGLRYTAAQSRSIAFGSATVAFGEDVGGDTLVEEITATQRGSRPHLKLGPTTELGRFPPIPYEVAVLPDGVRRARAVVDAYAKAKQRVPAYRAPDAPKSE